MVYVAAVFGAMSGRQRPELRGEALRIMPLSSMTGFARAAGQTEEISWTWELRSVNGRGLDVRVRLPSGFEPLDAKVRQRVAAHLKRGNVQVSLQVKRISDAVTMKVNRALLDWLVEEARALEGRLGLNAGPVEPAALLGLRGVLEPVDEDPQALLDEAEGPLLESLETALADLVRIRQAEGARLKEVVAAQIDRIEALVREARANPARTPEAIRERLREQVQRLLETETGLDEDRLYQEAVLLAAKADVEEELDRLEAHVAAARELLEKDGPVGRRLDFLAQEFNREANTLCSKSNDVSLTRTGLELKAVIDQLREQVQNIE